MIDKVALNSSKTEAVVHTVDHKSFIVKFKDLGLTWEQGLEYIYRVYGTKQKQAA